MKHPNNSSAALATVLLAGAQAIIVLSSYGVHVLLARILGPESYGVFGIVSNTTFMLVIVLTTAIPSTVSRFLAADPTLGPSIFRPAFIAQALSGIMIAGGYFLTAAWVASFLGDADLRHYLQVSAPFIPAYALVCLYTGYLAGLQLFGHQASLQAAYGVVRVVVTGTMAVAFGLIGAIAAIAVAPLVTVALGHLMLPNRERPTSPGSLPYAEAVGFAIPVTILALVMQLLQTFDLYLVKLAIADDALVGYYYAASAIGRVPYFILAALGQLLLPRIASGLSRADVSGTRQIVRQSIRVTILVSVPAIAFTAPLGKELTAFAFSANFVAAADPLPLLVASSCLLSLFNSMAAVLAASHRQWRPAITSLLLLPLGYLLGLFLVPQLGLRGAAVASMVVASASGVALLYDVSRVFAISLPLKTILRSSLAVTPFALGLVWLPAQGVASLVAATFGGLGYVGLLRLSGELDRADIGSLIGALRKVAR